MAYLTYEGLQRYHNGVKLIISSALENFSSTRYYVCQTGEYDTTTYIPTLEGELGVIYLVPKSIDNSTIGTATVGTGTILDTTNVYFEFIYTGDKFEKIGDTRVNLTGYLTESDIATDSAVDTMLTQVFS